MKKNKTTKKIGIDARFYGPIGKGLGRYTQEIVDNIIKIDKENEYVIFLRLENYNEFSTDNKKVKKVLADVNWYSLSEQIKMPRLIFKERLDSIHFLHFNVPIICPVKFIVTIHDLILTKFPTQRATTLGPVIYKLKKLLYKIVIWTAVKRSKIIIAVSEFTKKDIIEYFKIKPEKILVTYEGVANLAKNRDDLFTAKVDDKKTLLGYNINSPYLLYVGNAYPHKNLEGLIKVFIKLIKDNPNLQLVLVGKEDYFYSRIKQIGSAQSEKIIFPGFVSDEKLEILFKNALAYIFPSLYEGFGLPPLEAMAKGCPVVSSNKASMPEILGEAAVYFNPDNQEEMQSKIELVINNKELRQNLIKKGFEQAKLYSWWECARKTLKIYNKILIP